MTRALTKIDPPERALALLDQAERALAEAVTIQDFKAIRDAATAVRAWARSRKAGLPVENRAAEVILRAERGTGIGLRQVERKLTSNGRELTPYQQVLVDIEETTPAGKTVKASRPAEEWQRLAQLTDEVFEKLLSVKDIPGARISKFNFYNAIKRSQEGPALNERPTPEDPGFGMFRAGAYTLLGWVVDEDGYGKPTKNGLLLLPDDELAQTEALIRSLATAYNVARSARE